jgi:hypothetical protein
MLLVYAGGKARSGSFCHPARKRLPVAEKHREHDYVKSVDARLAWPAA